MGFMAAALPALIGAGGSLLGGLFGSNASQQASQQYIQALQQAEGQLQGSEQQGLQQYAPYQKAGNTAAATLGDLTGTPGQGLLQNWTGQFTAPTAAQAAQTPGYQFQLQQGENATQNSAAGQGGLLSGRTLADLNNYAQGTASSNYQNVFNNSLQQYNSAYNTFLNNQNNTYSRLMGVSGQGLQAAGGAANLIGNLGGDIASMTAQQGAAQAGGTLGSANAWSNAISGIGGAISNGMTLGSLNGGGSMTNFNPNIWTNGGSMPGYGGGMQPPFSPINLPGMSANTNTLSSLAG